MAEEISPISYEDLASIEAEFEEIDVEILRQQYTLSKSAYARRAEAVAKIPNFWALVFEQAPDDISSYVQTEDSRVLAESLLEFKVTRPELDTSLQGSPRSFTLHFDFKPNDDFEDTTLEKTFWYRRTNDGWAGLVSEPVKIHWKTGKDLTEGLTDGAVALWEARKKGGDMTSRALPEYAELKKKVAHWNGGNTSFFALFGWVSDRRWVSAEESAQANAAHKASKQAAKLGGGDGAAAASEDDPDDAINDDSEVEIHQAGDELAISIADELWPGAIRLFTLAQEDDGISEVDFEEDSDEVVSSDDEGPVDIRALVNTGRDSGPPAKRQKK